MTVHLFLSGETADDRTKEHQQEHEDADAAYEVAVTDEERPAVGQTHLAYQSFPLPPGSTFDYPSCLVSIALSDAYERCCLYPGVSPHQASLVMMDSSSAPLRI